MKVSGEMTPNPATVSPDDSIRHAAALMRQLNVGVLPVCDDDRLVGIVTDRDITVRATALGSPPDSTNVSEVLTEPVRYLAECSDIEEAVELMRAAHIRRVPIVNGDNRLIGILSLSDLAINGERGAAEVLQEISQAGFKH
jgi:CBS domain-containing protein